ncbi:MAG: hypothetical protein P0Y66_06680 [Candidatus Kaistia colombiensis]|nr:MAG: hypothetical protein P0Y66_06680 [Kaistia sp.]
MQLRSSFDVSPASQRWHGSSASRSALADGRRRHARLAAMARHHPEELGVVLRLVAVMAFFGITATLLAWVAG